MEDDTTFEIIDGSPRTEEAVRQRNRDLNQRNSTNRGKWHTPGADRWDEDQGSREFRNQGALVTVAREPPQNSTDNPLDDGKPVVLRYSLRDIPSTPEMRDRYLPQNPWVDHVTTPRNGDIVSYREDYGDSLLDSISDSIRVLVVEDYNATGLVGDTDMLFPNENNEGDFDQETKDNTFFWFMRSRGAQRPQAGRGGSWGLGKLAFPLASAVRTFFVVTTREDGSRYLSGQTILKPHQVHGKMFGEIMYFADEDLIISDKHGESEHFWKPISDSNAIDEFCDTFKLNRNTDEPGTSMVIILPKKELSDEKLKVAVLANYCVPVMSRKLEIEISDEDGGYERVNSRNVREIVSELEWSIISRNAALPAWSTKGRMNELINLYETMRDAKSSEITKLILEEPLPNQSPSTSEQFDRILPKLDSEDLIRIKDAFLAGKPVVVRGTLPVHHRDDRGIMKGNYSLVFRKCEDPADAEAHFYRNHISLPLCQNREAIPSGVSSLLLVGSKDMDNPDPLAELLRSSEGPAHLWWDQREDGMKRQYEYGPSTISFLKAIVNRIVARITSVDTEREDIWTDIFSLGGKPKPPEIERRFRIDENSVGGCTITPIESKEDMVGMSFIVRVGYPKPFSLNPKSPPDYRSIDVHSMVWDAKGATITKDVNASNGELCIDRVRMTITDPEFEVVLKGVDTELKAQAIITEEADV